MSVPQESNQQTQLMHHKDTAAEKPSFLQNPFQFIKGMISPEKSSSEAEAPLSMADRKKQLESAQRNQKGDGIEKVAASTYAETYGADLENLSKEELIERSWDFLTHITERVSTLPEATQQKILDIGRQLSKSGAAYGHTVPDRREFLRSAQKSSHSHQ